MSFLRFVFIKLASSLALVVLSTLAIFLLMRLLGNPIEIALAGRVSESEIALRTEEGGLNRPLFTQLFEYLGQLMTGSLGKTILSSQNIGELVWNYIPVSFEYGILVLMFGALVGVPLGYYLAKNPDSKTSHGVRVISILTYAIPIFLIGVIIKIILTVWLPVFPVAGQLTVNSQITLDAKSQSTGFIVLDSIGSQSWGVLIDFFIHMALPVLTVGLVIASSLTRAVRAALLEQIQSDWYREAKNRFGDNTETKLKHLFRPAFASTITFFGTQAIVVLSGMVFAERIFEIRGLGYLLTEAVLARDYNLVQGIVVILAIIVTVINVLADLVAALIDPRFRRLAN